MPSKVFHARYTRKPWPVSRPCAEANMACPHFIAVVGLNQPSFFVLEPAELCHPSLKDCVFVKPKVLPNALRVLIDFWCKGIAEFGHIARPRGGDDCGTQCHTAHQDNDSSTRFRRSRRRFQILTPSMPAWTRRAAVSIPTQPPPMTTSRSSLMGSR